MARTAIARDTPSAPGRGHLRSLPAPSVPDHHRAAALLFLSAERSLRAARECARGAAAAALVAIASVAANGAVGIAASLVLSAALLVRRIAWLGSARSQRAVALEAEMAAAVAASDWRARTKWGLRRSA
jgi:hypothetical protein